VVRILELHPFSVALRQEVHLPVDPLTATLYLLTALAVGVLTRRRPALGVAALVLIAPFGVDRYIGPTTVSLLKAGVVGLLVALAVGRPSFAGFRTWAVRLVVLGFALALGATLLSAREAEHLGPVVREAFKALEYAVLFGAALVAFVNDPDDRPFWRAIEAATVLVSLSALAEYAFGAHSGILVFGHPVPRIAGVLEGPNQLSGWLEIVVPVLLARALIYRDRLLVAVIVIAAIVDVLTFSRGGVVGMLIAASIVLLAMNVPARKAIFAGLLVCVVMLVALAVGFRHGLPEHYFSVNQTTQVADHLGNRAELWSAAIDLWHRSPITGVGAGNYELDLAEVGLPDVRTHANSLYLQSLAEGGIVMLAAMLAQYGLLLMVLRRSGVSRPLVVGAFAGAVALLGHQIVDDLMFFTKVGSMFWLVMGVAIAEVAARRLFELRSSESASAAR
jgi:O-antigen ligase